MRLAMRPVAAAALTVLAACGSITDPSGARFPESPLFARKPRPTPPRPPILFVHGWNSSASVWTTMMGRFRNDGWPDSRLVAFSYNYAASNATTADVIAQKVDELRAANNGAPVAIVTHSMGTLSARYYVRNVVGAEAKVSSIVSLAGTNHGTTTAGFCAFLNVSCQEMLPGSTFLNTLNSVDETWGTPQYATWWSPCDEVINPRSSTSLVGAANTQTACLTHSQLHQDSRVYGQVRDFVNQAAAATFVASVN